MARILSWADARRARTGRWPACIGGQVRGAPDEPWVGLRGLSGGDALLMFFRNVRR